MAKQTIFRGTLANDGTGDNLRLGANKINDNFTELYTLLGDGSTLSAGTIVTTTESQTLTNKSIDGSNNTITNIPSSALSTIANSKLANSTISIGGITFNLGDTDATPALNLTDATSYPTTSLTGTITNAQLAGSITNDKLVNNTIRIGDDSSTNFNIGLGESFEIIGGSGITTAITNNRISLSVASLPNTSLQNSSMTLGSDSIALGETKTSIAGLSLTGSGTVDLTGAGSKMRFDFAGYGSLPTASTYVGMYAYDSTGNRPYYSSGSGWVRVLDENSSVSAHTDVNITGVSDGDVLTFNSAQGRFNAVAPTGGSVALDDLTDVTNSSPTAGMSLVYDGSGWVQATTPVSQFIVTASDANGYEFQGAGFPAGQSADNPDLHIKKGQTYYFRNTSGGHPFRIQSTTGTGGTAYNTGVTNNNASGPSGVIVFHVPMDAPATLYYQCTSHSAMVGNINIT